MGTLIDPGVETPALRRTRVLLSRVREDGSSSGDAEGLDALVSELWRAVSDGRLLEQSAVDGLDRKLSSLREPSIAEGDVTVPDLLLHNAFMEAHDLLSRLRKAQARTRQSAAHQPQRV